MTTLPQINLEAGKVYRSTCLTVGTRSRCWLRVEKIHDNRTLTITSYHPESPRRPLSTRAVTRKGLDSYRLELCPVAEEPEQLRSERGKALAEKTTPAAPESLRGSTSLYERLSRPKRFDDAVADMRGFMDAVYDLGLEYGIPDLVIIGGIPVSDRSPESILIDHVSRGCPRTIRALFKQSLPELLVAYELLDEKMAAVLGGGAK